MSAIHDSEKQTAAEHLTHVKTDDSASSSDLNDARINQFSPEEQKKIMWRIDRRLVLTCGFLYCVSLMDRTNTGFAVVAGMGVDLKLIKFRYSTIVLVFFVTYTLLQPVATVVMRKVGPRVFLPSITLAWGIVTIGMGFATEWWEMIPLRMTLGILEAGFFPGCAYLLSCWYPRFELQKRNAVFYLIGSMSSAFAGILAYGFSQMEGLGHLGTQYGKHIAPTKANPRGSIRPGISGWRWIFIMQGVLTVIIAAIGAFTIVDFPDKAARGNKSKGFAMAFLTEKEAEFVVARIEKDRHDAIPEKFSLGNYLRNALDLKVWGFAALFMLTTTNTYAIAFFLPIILREGLGFSIAEAQCLGAPPNVLAAIVMFCIAIFSDKYHIRGPLIIAMAVIGIIGLALLGFTKNPSVRYFGVFLAVTACNSNIPAILTFQANNIRGQWKRALASATLVGAGGLGGIIGTTVFRSQDAPNYRPGLITCILASSLIVVIVALLDLKFYFANKRADKGGKIIEGLPGFRYTI